LKYHLLVKPSGTSKTKTTTHPPRKINHLKGSCCLQTNTDQSLVMEETIYLKVDRGMQMSHTEQNFLGREDNFLHSTQKLVVIRID
jgi:hypothetical protein